MHRELLALAGISALAWLLRRRAPGRRLQSR